MADGASLSSSTWSVRRAGPRCPSACLQEAELQRGIAGWFFELQRLQQRERLRVLAARNQRLRTQRDHRVVFRVRRGDGFDLVELSSAQRSLGGGTRRRHAGVRRTLRVARRTEHQKRNQQEKRRADWHGNADG